MAERVQFNNAGRDAITGAKLNVLTGDSFQNMAAQLGFGTNNQSSASRYGFHPISRIRTQLEFAYRGSWVVGVAVDAVADDMTRAGVEIHSGLKSNSIEKLQIAMQRLAIWNKMNETIRWSRLYGGAIGVMLIDGQLPQNPLKEDRVGRKSFKGMYVFDRWQVEPSLNDLVTEAGPDAGNPRFYKINSNSPVYPNCQVHYSRCVRIEGIELPFNQRQSENLWGMSILERLYDRLIAFDSATVGAAQLVYKAHIRTLSIEKLRELIALGGKSYQAVIAQVGFIRQFQTNEGITLLDSTDKFEAHQYQFSGLGDMLLQFAQQVAGALQIPLVRLLGQAPAGLNATGDADFRNYYDGIRAAQEARLRRPMDTMLRVLARSELGSALPDDFSFTFAPLWQMSATEKATLAELITGTVSQAYENGLIDKATALEELRNSSRLSGIWTSITDDLIAAAKLEPPVPMAESAAPPGSEPPAPAATATPPLQSSVAPSEAPTNPDAMGSEDETTPGDQISGMDEPGPTTQIDIDFDTKQVDVKLQGVVHNRVAVRLRGLRAEVHGT